MRLRHAPARPHLERRIESNLENTEFTMKHLIRCWISLLLLPVYVAPALAGTATRIADGDCTALTAAAASPPGQEPSLIVLARNGTYGACSLTVSGKITIDGAGAQMQLVENRADPSSSSQITIAAGAQLLIRNINFGNPSAGSATAALAPKFLVYYFPAVRNDGTFVLDSISMANEPFGVNVAKIGGGFVANSGKMHVRNSSFFEVINNPSGLFAGDVEISHISLVDSSGVPALGDGNISIANSVIAVTRGNACRAPLDSATRYVSLGGNVVSDGSCGFNAPNDRVSADVRFLDFNTHGGIVRNLALNYDSPAIGNGVPANCEATDARGLSRGASACDSGAYEVGGGNGKLTATGMSGLYFNAANNGHYVSIQRLYGNQALVIWNTFDEHGVPAWLYGVGTIDGTTIHVPQVAQNVGGTLHPGGAVSGATPTLWGSFDVNLSDCYNATLTYSSPLPEFGTGSTTLQRLAYLDGVNCAR
jgi:hypothetical protein